VSGQTNGDSFVLLKSAMPIATYAHVHYDRLYMIDERDKTKVRISGPSDPQDMTTTRQTLDSNTQDFGSKQSQGDVLLCLDTFQRYLVAGGKQRVYMLEGTTPIADTTADVVDLAPVGLFPQGVVSDTSFANIGGGMVYAAQDGLRRFDVTDILAVATDNASEVIKSELRERILTQTQAGTVNQIQVVHYPRRNWVLFKAGDIMYCFNYSPIYSQGQLIANATWSKFTGKLAECDAFILRANGDLICADQDGNVYQFDVPGALDDAGTSINTEYQTAWITPGVESGGTRVMDGKYIRPFFETKGAVNYTIAASAELGSNRSSTSIRVSAVGGGGVGVAIVGTTPVGGISMPIDPKLPLRWRGKQARFTITTSGGRQDTISKFALYGNGFGRE